MKLFKLQIVTPDGMKYDGDAVQLSVRGIEGDLAILAGHIPFVTALKEGECRIYTGNDGEIKVGECTGGMLMVSDDGVNLISSDFAFREQ